MGGDYELKLAPPGVEVTNETLEWTSQEPLLIIGAQLEVASKTWSENDGKALLAMELSFSAALKADVAFLSAMASDYWNTAPPGILETQGNVTLMFPEGYALSMKEGETIYLNRKQTLVKSAASSFFSVNAHLFYVKGTVTK